MSIAFDDFDILNPKLVNGTVIEASAGTGKTFSVASIVTRAIALDENVRIGNVLVTTFTRNAAAELRDRIRRRIVSTEDQLRGGVLQPGDQLAESLLNRTDLNGQHDLREHFANLIRQLLPRFTRFVLAFLQQRVFHPPVMQLQVTSMK